MYLTYLEKYAAARRQKTAGLGDMLTRAGKGLDGLLGYTGGMPARQAAGAQAAGALAGGAGRAQPVNTAAQAALGRPGQQAAQGALFDMEEMAPRALSFPEDVPMRRLYNQETYRLRQSAPQLSQDSIADLAMRNAGDAHTRMYRTNLKYPGLEDQFGVLKDMGRDSWPQTDGMRRDLADMRRITGNPNLDWPDLG